MVQAVRGSVLVLGVAALLATSACLPTQPEGRSVGVRLDDGVITMLVPLCAGEVVEAVEVRAVTPEDRPAADWRASGDLAGGNVLTLSSEGWRETRGSYEHLGAISIDVATDRGYLGTVIDDLDEFRGLPDDTYVVDGQRQRSDEVEAGGQQCRR
ncbi:hypothetical protein [Cellulomonas massiliensis]|uniref:hypothetical protein n=1 Tax=Cellulomonas massiliensis TaxID=1465811 RepID=UPI00035CF7A7|nr:hypothetical protein [Cellulomonas massiliensis]